MRASASDEAGAFEAVARVLASLRSVEEMQRFLAELLTPGEIRDIALRWRLLERLAGGVPQRRIADELQVSLCKITRGSRILKQRGSLTARVLAEQAEQRRKDGG